MTQREEDYKRICRLSGVDENGCLIPDVGGGIDRNSPQHWRTNGHTFVIEEMPTHGHASYIGSGKWLLS